MNVDGGNVDYEKLVDSTRRVFEQFPELGERLNELVQDDDPPLVYTAMTLLARTLIHEMAASRTGRFPPLFATVESILRVESFDVRNLVISGLLEDLWNLSVQVGIEPIVWEKQLGEASLAGWRAVLDFWNGKLTGEQYNSILRRD